MQSVTYMQAQQFFVEHCIRESNQIPGVGQFQTRLWLDWQHQVALNFLVSSFMLKEKLRYFDDLLLLSASDIKEWLVFMLSQGTTEEQMMERLYKRHQLRQRDIKYSYSGK